MDFKKINRNLLLSATSHLSQWLPGGKLNGQEWECGSLMGERGKSLKVNINKGKWADFATGESGGDLISLYAAINNISQGEAAKQFNDIQIEQKNVKKQLTKAETFCLASPHVVGEPKFSELKHFGCPTEVYKYMKGELVAFYVARYDNNGDKTFRPWSFSELRNKWVPKQWPGQRPLYKPGGLYKKNVLIVEGEKCANAAPKIVGGGYSVVTWAGGANAVKKTDWSELEGHNVLIWPDADEAGKKAGDTISGILKEYCDSVKILNVKPGDKDAAEFEGDFEDWKTWAKPILCTHISSQIETSPEVIRQPEVEVVNAPLPPEPPEEDEPREIVINEAVQGHLGYMALDGKDNPICSLSNLNLLATNDPSFEDFVWLCQFHNKIRTKWKTTDGKPRDFEEKDFLELKILLQSKYNLHKIRTPDVQELVCVIANRNTKNEAADWLNSLEWDGINRLDQFALSYLGCEDNEYTRAVGANMFKAMAARILRPGVKADNMVILEGKQGKGKSSFVKALGGDWYGNVVEAIGSKDFFQKINEAKIVCEFGELEGFDKTDVRKLKNIIDLEVDDIRLPYAKHGVKMPRQCLFIGTTNDENYLHDTTGNRRFWPLETGVIKLEQFKTDKNQLLAEAVQRINNNETWWEMPKTAKKEQEKRQEDDPWVGLIQQECENLQEMTHGNNQIYALHFALVTLDKVTSFDDRKTIMRINRILKALGYHSNHNRKTKHGQQRCLVPPNMTKNEYYG